MVQWSGGILTDVGDQICCDYPATLGEVVQVVCDSHDSCANYGNVEVDEKYAKKKPASIDSTCAKTRTPCNLPRCSGLQLPAGEIIEPRLDLLVRHGNSTFLVLTLVGRIFGGCTHGYPRHMRQFQWRRQNYLVQRIAFVALCPYIMPPGRVSVRLLQIKCAGS